MTPIDPGQAAKHSHSSESTLENRHSERRGRGWETLCVHLSKNTTIQGHLFKNGTEVYYSRQGKLISAILSGDTTLQGCLFKGGTIIHFYNDGCIEWASLSDTTRITPQETRIPELMATRSIYYYRNGNIKETTLAKEITLQSHLFQVGTVIHLSSDGLLVWAQLSQDTVIVSHDQILSVARQSCVRFYRNGAVNTVTLADEVAIHGHRFEKEALVNFDSAGRLVSAEIYGNPSQPRLFSNRDTIIHFNPDQSIRSIDKRDCHPAPSSDHTGTWTGTPVSQP